MPRHASIVQTRFHNPTQKIREIGVSAVKSEIRSSHVTNKIRTADCADCADFFEK
jgi:hypothetical protein